MSVIRPRPPEEPLAYSVAGGPAVADEPAAELAAVRDAMVAEPAGNDLASRLLADYDTHRPASELFAILGRARTLRDAVDRLVVVADGGIGPATRLLVATCCHPVHDQLSRGERGGRPRISWLDGSAGNDEVQGLLDLLGRDPHGADDLLDRWGLIVADGAAAAPVAAILRDRLEAAVGGDRRLLADRLVSLDAGPTSDDERGRSDEAVPRGAEVFTVAGLLPAAIAGIDVVRLLKAAAAMGRRFAEAPVAENPPLLDAAAARSAATAGRPGRLFAGSGRWLGELSAWHGCLRPTPPGAAALVTLLAPGEPRRDRLPGLPAGGGGPAVAADVWIGLPRLDEHAVGQLLQLLVLSAAVERRL
jgi:glucose-6-phosphate isomerase